MKLIAHQKRHLCTNLIWAFAATLSFAIRFGGVDVFCGLQDGHADVVKGRDGHILLPEIKFEVPQRWLEVALADFLQNSLNPENVNII